MAGSVQHKEHDRGGTFFLEENGERIALMTYRRESAGLVTINHTKVDPEHEGQGLGRDLLDAAVDWARKTGTKFKVTCPFASAQFERDPSIRDVLA